MPKNEKNIYYKINDKESRLVVTKRNREFFRFKIDTEDIPIFKKYSWFIKKDCYLYTVHNGKELTPGEILFHPKEKGMVFDHKNRNPFDYSKENLRYVTWQTNINNRWKPRTDAGDVYGIFKTDYGYRTRAADGTFPTFKNWMNAAACRVNFLLSRGLEKLEAVQMLDFNDLDEWEFMVNLCCKPA